MRQPTKDCIMGVFGKRTDGISLVLSASGSKELMMKIGILQEKVGFLTIDVKSAIYELLSKLKNREKWQGAKDWHLITLHRL